MKKMTIEEIEEGIENALNAGYSGDIVAIKDYERNRQKILTYWDNIHIYEVVDGWRDNNLELVGYYSNKKDALNAFRNGKRNGNEI